MTLSTLPSLLGIVALAFLALLLVKTVIQPAADKVAKTLLVLLLIGMLCMAFCLFYIYASMGQEWPRLSSIEIGFSWWIGPSLYFYLQRINGGPDPFARRFNLLHWAPALIIELVLLPFFLRPLPGTTDALGLPVVYDLLLIRYIWAGFHVQLLVYILRCQPGLALYRQRLRDNYSDISLLNLRWLQFCCAGFIGMILAERLLPVLGLTTTNLSQLAGSTLYLFIITLMYLALGQSRLPFASAAPAAGSKYQRSGLRDDTAQYHLDKLAALMAAERCFLQGDLSLQTLAERVGLSPHHLSQILNDKLGKNFYDYINEQRVEYAKRVLVDEPHKAIVDVAFDAGYNSKNSFYNAFKRHAGMSPSDWRQGRSVPAAATHTPPGAP